MTIAQKFVKKSLKLQDMSDSRLAPGAPDSFISKVVSAATHELVPDDFHKGTVRLFLFADGSILSAYHMDQVWSRCQFFVE